ncbi:MAG TPA: hypothetical protein VHH33_03190, partial [Nitrososphaeraceae archaeon]|nr:hypothetical protein [Nitrososphaeraceae archaeon]
VIIAMQIIMRTILILSSSICSATDIPDEDEDITIFENMQSRYNNYIELSIHIQEKHPNEYLL